MLAAVASANPTRLAQLIDDLAEIEGAEAICAAFCSI